MINSGAGIAPGEADVRAQEKYYKKRRSLMGNQIDVYVVDSDGDPVSGKRVLITVMPGLDLTGGEIEEFTDDEGHASFETTGDYDDSHEIYIRVGDHVEQQEIGGGAFTIQLD